MQVRRPKEYESALKEPRTKKAIQNDIDYYATYSSAKHVASAIEVAYTYHKECVDGDPPKESRDHDFMERLIRRFALDKQQTTESLHIKYNDWKIAIEEDPMSAMDRWCKKILRL